MGVEGAKNLLKGKWRDSRPQDNASVLRRSSSDSEGEEVKKKEERRGGGSSFGGRKLHCGNSWCLCFFFPFSLSLSCFLCLDFIFLFVEEIVRCAKGVLWACQGWMVRVEGKD